ncbi:hypothetical protein GJ496_002189 [Pomphorhynchus laevis]|nr:hypothetical protein GJ496_002189 [Pomphorhynchus laevis]
MRSIGIIGSGNWGTAIAKVIGENVEKLTAASASENNMMYNRTVKMYVYEELVDNGQKLSEVINKQRENVKYLPGHRLPDCVVASSDITEVSSSSDILFIVMPHQYLADQCVLMKNSLKPGAFAVSLCKGFMHENEESQVTLISEYISRTLDIPCHVLMGASIANEVAAGKFCESTVGSKILEHGIITKQLVETDYFRVQISLCAEIVEICGAVKNVVAVAAGFCDGLGYGGNTKAAVIRIGLIEMIRFAKLMYKCTDESVFMESCGVADLIATCYGGRNRKIAEAFVRQKKSIDVLENELLNGQKLQGPSTARDMMKLIRSRNVSSEFPLFRAVYEICYETRPVNSILNALI